MRSRVMRWSVGVESKGGYGWVQGAVIVALAGRRKLDTGGDGCRFKLI